MKKAKPVYVCHECEATLPKKRQFCDDRCKQINLCKSKGTTKYKTQDVAPVFQRMVRAEHGAKPDGYSLAVVDGVVTPVFRTRGFCSCVTCGTVCPWEGGSLEKQLHAGHFLAGRGAILFEEACVAPQCSNCNRHHGGRPQEYRLWMETVHGLAVVEELEFKKRQPLSRSRDELVDMRLEFRRRLKAAQELMKGKR